MPNEENINPNITPDLEPIEGEPGWYFDRNTGQTIHESELGGLFDDEPEDEDWDYEEDDEDDDRRDNDRREKNDKDDEAQEEENPNPENENNPGEGPEGEPEPNPAGESMPEGGESLAEGGAEAAGEAGAEAAAEAGAELAAETAAEVAAEAAATEAAAASAVAVESTPVGWILTAIVAIIIVVVLVVVVVLAFMAYSEDSANADTTSGTSGPTIICLDAGHGAADSGAVNGSFEEASMNLTIVKELKPKLEKEGYTVITTRLDDSYVGTSKNTEEESKTRSQFCSDQGATLMYRVHLDASNSPQKTFHILPGPKYDKISATSISYGENIHKTMIKELGSLVTGGSKPLTDGGTVKEGVDYNRELKGTVKANELGLPIVWLEALAIDNAGVTWINNATNRESLENAIVKGFLAAIPPSSGTYGDAVVAKARTQLGKPYVFGACHNWTSETTSNGCDSYDCSGLTGWAWYWGTNKAISIGATTDVLESEKNNNTKYRYFTTESEAKPGDLVLYPGHVGIYVGGGNKIHAPQTGDVVKENGVGSPSFFLRPLN